MTIKLDEELEVIGEATVDDRERVSLTRALKLIRERFGDRPFRFQVLYSATSGTIALAPATTVPLREAWLYENPEALKMVRAGIEAAGRGEIVKRESFAKHADDEIE
jgi:hypothetical protein